MPSPLVDDGRTIHTLGLGPLGCGVWRPRAQQETWASATSLRALRSSRTIERKCSRLHFEILLLAGQGDSRGKHTPRSAECFLQE